MSKMETTGFLRFNSAEATVVIQQWRSNTHFMFLGASCPTNIPPHFESLTMLSLEPRKGMKEVIAVAVTVESDDRRRPTHHANFLLSATFEDGKHDGKPWVDSENPFSLASGRLGGIVGGGNSAGLSVRVGERTFVYPPLALSTNTLTRLTEKGHFVVSDGNVLCRYMTGEATAKEVEAAVVARPNEKTVFEKLAEAERALEAEKKHAMAAADSHKTQIEILEKREEVIRQCLAKHDRFIYGCCDIVFERDGAKGWFAYTDTAKMRRLRELINNQ